MVRFSFLCSVISSSIFVICFELGGDVCVVASTVVNDFTVLYCTVDVMSFKFSILLFEMVLCFTWSSNYQNYEHSAELYAFKAPRHCSHLRILINRKETFFP